MTYIHSLIALWGTFYTVDFMVYWFFPLFALFFLASFPCFIRSLLFWR